MSPHGSSPKKAKEPNELYDKLSQTGQDVWDLIGSHGFRPDQNEKKEWIALATQGDDIIGPCESLSALGTAVEQHVKAKAKTAAAGSTSESVEEEPAEEERRPRVFKVKMPDGLTLADAAIFSEIKTLGFSPVHEDDGWIAIDQDEDREQDFGPEKHLKTLLTKIKEALTDNTEVTLEVDHQGQRFLDGMAPTVNRQLADGIVFQHEMKMKRVAATADETKGNKQMEVLGKLHGDLYKPDPAKPGTKVYKVGKIVSRMSITEDVKFTTEEEKDEE